MKKFKLGRAVIALVAVALVANGIAPSSAATLRVPKTAFPACAVQNGIYCIESVTVTTTLGTVGLVGGTFGRSVVLPYSNNGVAVTDSITVQLRPDGGVGTATITISTPTVVFASKTATFYSSAPATYVVTSLISTLSDSRAKSSVIFSPSFTATFFTIIFL